MTFTSGNDINILQPTNPGVVGAGDGNDTYILAQNFLSAGQKITISDSVGANTLQLIGGLTIASHKISGSSIQLTLSNDAVITVLGANNFNYKVGGNPLSGVDGVSKSFQAFATESLGATEIPTGTAIVNSTGSVLVNSNGTTTITNPGTPDIGSAVKAPWTLMMHAGTGSSFGFWTSGGIFTSDGSAAGTQLNVLTGYSRGGSFSYQMGVRFKTTEDQSKAYFYNIVGSGSDSFGGFSIVGSVGVSNGTATGTQLLMTAPANNFANLLPGNFVAVVGGKLIMAGGQQGPNSTNKILVSDGTISGTTLQTTDYGVPLSNPNSNFGLPLVRSVLFDTANQAAWYPATTAPYGNELIRFSYVAGTTPSIIMVKDIAPGSLSSLDSTQYDPVFGAILPSGKLIFRANDGVTRDKVWVSDSTNAGTFKLADYDNAMYFTTFGSKVAFSAFASTYGSELVFTDGTSVGTSVLDINIGPNSSNPKILGQANGLLYLTATVAAPTIGISTTSIFSTNGTTFTRLADINSSASLLGLSTNKAYFKSSDVTRGNELWVADLVGSGGFTLVKDILAGSGSALAENYNINPTMVGGKLMFNAYTSATQQALFVSDGTSVGTVQLSNGLPLQSKVVGNTLVFATADGVFGTNVASAVPNAIQLVSTTNMGTTNGISTFFPASSSMQTDADQVFFKTNNGDLYSTNGNISGTIKLAGSVEKFKLVAENALFFVQKSGTANATLWYSDGTGAGTRFVEALPANFSYDMDNAVAITTVGVAAP